MSTYKKIVINNMKSETTTKNLLAKLDTVSIISKYNQNGGLQGGLLL